MSGTPGQLSIWTEHRNPEGRTYWFNTGTKESVWEKPDDLKTPFEKALNQTKWKEYFSSGRKYYYNTESKESKWDMPDELIFLLEKVEKEAKALPPAPSNAIAPAAPTFTPPQSNALNGADHNPNGGGALPFAHTSVLPARPNLPDDPVIPHNGFATAEEGEKAFVHLLKKAGVDANWTWDQTMRAIITDPLYKALNTLAEKKAAWQKYTDGLRAKEQEEKEARLSKLRPAIRNMLKGNPNVFHYTTFATADKLFAQHPIWQQAKIEVERKLIFDEYVAELKQREVQETRAARARSISKVVVLFKELNVDVTTRWRRAQELLVDSDEWKNDPELAKLPSLDVLLAFEDYSRVKEREFEEQMRRSQVEKTRKQRKAREAFKGLLQELVSQGKIKARSKWKNVYPSFANDDRYLNMLGNPGSNPLELFWDLVDKFDQVMDSKLAIVEAIVEKHNKALETNDTHDQPYGEDHGDKSLKIFAVQPETTEEELLAVVKNDTEAAAKNLTDEDLRECFELLYDQALKKQAEERRRHERKQRHLQDDLRYALKKLSEPIDVNMSYEAAVPLMAHLPEYKAIEDEESRRAAFAKFLKRQKERIREAASEDGGSTTSRKRKEPVREHREPERDRDRSEKDRDRDRDSHRDRDRTHDRDRDRDRPREYEKESRSSRYLHRDEHENHGYGHRSVRDYKDRGDHAKERDKEKDPYEKDRDREYRPSRHHRESERDDRKRDRKSSRADFDHGKDSDDVAQREERGRSVSSYKDERIDEPREKREHSASADDKLEKRARYERDGYSQEPTASDRGKIDQAPPRAESPEEGEI